MHVCAHTAPFGLFAQPETRRANSVRRTTPRVRRTGALGRLRLAGLDSAAVEAGDLEEMRARLAVIVRQLES